MQGVLAAASVELFSLGPRFRVFMKHKYNQQQQQKCQQRRLNNNTANSPTERFLGTVSEFTANYDVFPWVCRRHSNAMSNENLQCWQSGSHSNDKKHTYLVVGNLSLVVLFCPRTVFGRVFFALYGELFLVPWDDDLPPLLPFLCLRDQPWYPAACCHKQRKGSNQSNIGLPTTTPTTTTKETKRDDTSACGSGRGSDVGSILSRHLAATVS